MADPIFTYENVKNNKEIGDQWRNYVLQKFKDRPSWLLLTQSLGDNNTLQIDKLTPESFNTLTKIYGAPASYKDGSTDTTPLTPPLMQKSAQQTPDNNNDKTGNVVARGDAQGSNNGSGGVQAGNGTLASAGVAKGGTKTIGYDPNPDNVSLAYAMRNAPEQERRAALINEWNKEHGISYATGKDGLIYRTDPQHPNGYVDPFKNDLSKTGSTGYATGKGMLTSGSNGSYSSQEGIETPMPANASGKFKVAWKDPMAIIGHFGRRAFTDDEYNQLVNHAVNDLEFNENLFSGR